MVARHLAVLLLAVAAPAAAELPIVTPAAGASLRAGGGRLESPGGELALYVGQRDDLGSPFGPRAIGAADLRLGLTTGSRLAGSLDAGAGLAWGLGGTGPRTERLRLALRPSIVARTDGLGVASELGVSFWPVAGVFPVILRYEVTWRGGEPTQRWSLLLACDVFWFAGLAMSS